MHANVGDRLLTGPGRAQTGVIIGVPREGGVPPYIVQHLSGAMVDYQNGHMSGADDNVEKLTGRRSMTVAEFAAAHLDVLNGHDT